MIKATKIFSFLLLLTLGFLVFGGQASAANTANFKAGRIIDDVNFFTPYTMTVNEIQAFLNAKVPTCDTNGTELSSHPNGSGGYYTRAQWGAMNGNPAPYTCLKNYSQATPTRAAEQGLCNGYNASSQQSAAQIIYNVSSSCGINPKVLIVLLQKEQGLVTDEWPWQVQYRSATGYGCPDTAPCDAEYYGFFNQVYAAARQFRKYSRDANSYSYRAGFNNSILYNPSVSCGSGNVYIENQATAGLYNYTPYQPNQAALNAGYGSAPPCGAYGNRNFWLYYNDWFGSTINDAYQWELVQESSTGKIYLIVNNVKHWVPGPSLLNAWGLNDVPYRGVDSTYVSNITSGANLTYVGLDVNGTRYLMSAGQKYRLASDASVLTWGFAGTAHISAAGYVAQLPSGGDAGRFATNSSTGVTYLLNGTTVHTGATTQSLSYWGQSSGNTTTVTADILARFSAGAQVDRYISAGGKDLIIDNVSALVPKNAAIKSAYGSQTYVAINAYASNLLPQKSATNFILNSSDGRWYYLEGGTKHYIPSSILATMWGWGSSNGLTSVTNTFASSLTSGSNLSYLAKTAAGNLYVVDGSKHLVDPAYAQLWEGGQTPPTFNDNAFSLLANGTAIQTASIGFRNSSKIYTIDDGELRHIAGPSILYALGVGRNNPIVTLDGALLNFIPQGPAFGSIHVQVTPGTTYTLGAGYKYTLDPASLASWGANNPSTVSSAYLNILTSTGATLKNSISISGTKYLVNNQTLLNVSGDYDNYGLVSSDFKPVAESYFPVRQSSSMLVGTPGSGKIWLLSMGKRYYISTPDLLYDLGYGSLFGVVSLDSTIVSSLPEENIKANQLLRSPNSGAIFTSTGRGYGFRDSSTLNDYAAGQVFMVSNAHFSRFSFVGWAEELISGTDGKIYDVSSGQKHWISGPSILYQHYSGKPILNLPQSTVNAMPTGSAVTE